MKINVVNTLDKVYGLQPKSVNSKNDKNEKVEDNSKTKSKADSLEISGDSRKIRLIQERVNEKYYEKDEIVNEIAKRMIEFSDI
ncbi:hypothetical protein MASR1M45_05720 [Candidatus Kapaibacterium sp.]